MRIVAFLHKALQWWNGTLSYERYLTHQRIHHPERPPLDRRAFFARETQRKWHGVRRCC